MAKNMTIIVNKEDINNPLHPYLWDSFLETLGIHEDATEICLERSLLDHNKLKVDDRDKQNQTVRNLKVYSMIKWLKKRRTPNQCRIFALTIFVLVIPIAFLIFNLLEKIGLLTR